MTNPEPVLPPEPDPENLLDAVNNLSRNVVTLTERLDVSAKIASRARLLSRVVAVVVVVALAFGGFEWHRVSNAIDGVDANAVQACENANDARAANLALWQFVLQLSEPKRPNPIEQAKLDLLQEFIVELFATHDCNDLSKVYKIPLPPILPTR